MNQHQTTSRTAEDRTARTEAGGQQSEQQGDPVTAALIALIDDALLAGTGRTSVLSAALEVIALEPTPADLAATVAEVHAEHDSLARVLAATVPGQRGTSSAHGLLVDVAARRDRRIEVLDMARSVIRIPGQRS